MGWDKLGVNSQVTWSARNGVATRWQPDAELPGHTPSVASRVNHVYPEVTAILDPAKVVPFVHRITTEFPFFIASKNLVLIQSSLTQVV